MRGGKKDLSMAVCLTFVSIKKKRVKGIFDREKEIM